MAEKEKRRATTFRTSKGTIVNVAAPTVYVSPAFLSTEDVTNPTEMGMVLEGVLGGGFFWTNFLNYGLDSYFIGRQGRISGDDSYLIPSTVWVRTPNTVEGIFTLPAGARISSVYSRKTFRTPTLTLRTKLPDWSGIEETLSRALYFGFENDSSVGTGEAMLLFNRAAITGVEAFYFWAGQYASAVLSTLTSFLPANYKTAFHFYTVKVQKSMALAYIDTALVAIAIFSPNFSYATTDNTPPYVLSCVPAPVSRHMRTIVEILTNNPVAVPLTAPISPYGFRVNEDEPEQGLSLPLYEANTSTTFAGKVIAAGTLTSHAFPLFGFEGKTICFQSNGAGSLVVQVLTNAGNWRTYDTVAVVANTLVNYSMAGDAVVGRVTFTPTAFPCTVNDGNVVLV